MTPRLRRRAIEILISTFSATGRSLPGRARWLLYLAQRTVLRHAVQRYCSARTVSASTGAQRTDGSARSANEIRLSSDCPPLRCSHQPENATLAALSEANKRHTTHDHTSITKAAGYLLIGSLARA